ncbi:unnamed protein product, partial [Meganyctiphanes norvegica]
GTMISESHSSTGCGAFLQDLTNRDLIKIKLLYFIILSGMVMIWPWFSLQQDALGISKRDTGIMGALQAVTFIIVPPIAGFVGDKLGNFKVLLFSMALLSALSISLFTVVPSAVDHKNTSNMTLFDNGTLLATNSNQSEFSETTLDYRKDRNDPSQLIPLEDKRKNINDSSQLNSSEKITANYALTFWTYFTVKALFGLAGIFFGFIETYMYLYLGKLGASNVLQGLTMTANVPIEFLLQVTISSIIQKIGYGVAIFIGTIGCFVRLLGFSLLSNPWYVLILELFEGIGNGFLQSAAIMYCGTLVTPSSIVTFRGIIGTVYWGLGPLIGSIAGGAISEELGDRLTFRLMSALALVVAFIYLLGYGAIIKFRRPKYMRNCAATPVPTNDDCSEKN